MKKQIKHIVIIVVVFFCLVTTKVATAQVQEMQQLILDIEKLTQLKGILSDMKTGYQIYQQGYGSISQLSKGNFDLHSVYLNGLLRYSAEGDHVVPWQTEHVFGWRTSAANAVLAFQS